MSDITTLEVVLASESTVGNPIIETVTVVGTVSVGPRGMTGPQGETGADSTVSGPQGETGPAGEDGADGPSAYEVAVEDGFVGNEAAWLASLVGAQGDVGPQGPAGSDATVTEAAVRAQVDDIYAPITEPIAAAHIADTTDAHDASAISIADAGGNFTGTDVEAALSELAAGGGGGGGTVESIVAGSNIDVDATDPANPIVSVETLVDADIPASIARDSEVASAVGVEEGRALAAEALLAPKASPALTGTPTAPTAAPGTNTTQLSTTAFVQAAVAALIASAPGALDTLDELAAALGDDANFAATMTTALAGKQPLDADLSALAAAGNSAVLAATTASFLTADETKLDGIEALADVTDATNVDAAGAVMNSDYDANTVLVATADNAPLPLTMAASTTLARLATGDIVAATPTQLRTLLALVIGTNVQAWDADLDAIAALTTTSTGRSLLAAADAAAIRTIAAAAPTASPTFTGTAPIIPDAAGATEAMNRQTSDARYAQVFTHSGGAYTVTGGRIFIGAEDPAADGFTPDDGDIWYEP